MHPSCGDNGMKPSQACLVSFKQQVFHQICKSSSAPDLKSFYLCSHAHVRIPRLAGMTDRGYRGKMHELHSSLNTSQLLLFSFPCNVSWCSSSLDLVKRSSGVAWQQPSAALSFQSPCSAVRLPPESCQDFPLFLPHSTFPSALPNNSNILLHSTLRVSPRPSSFFTFSPFCCLFINRLFPPTHRTSKPGFLGSP